MVECWTCPVTIMPHLRSPALVHPTPPKVLWTPTVRPLGAQRAGSLAHGVRLLAQCLHNEPPSRRPGRWRHWRGNSAHCGEREAAAFWPGAGILSSPWTPPQCRLACNVRDDAIGDEGNSATRGQHFLAPWRCGDAVTNPWNKACVLCIPEELYLGGEAG